jgi:endonuclease YncB( thermonuclease family)
MLQSSANKIAAVSLVYLLVFIAPYSFGFSHLPADKLAPPQAADKKLPAPIIGLARYVVDGDSLYLAGEKRQIRLWGVDAPERDEAGFDAARSVLKKLALNKRLQCWQQDIDRYGRIVARCWPVSEKSNSDDQSNATQAPDKLLDKSLEINRLMIKSGSAIEYCFFTDGYYGFC